MPLSSVLYQNGQMPLTPEPQERTCEEVVGHSCHPGPHGTCPASVPQPTGARDTACQRRPASPHRCVGCAPYNRVWRPPRPDCHTLCPDTGVGVPPQWAVVVPGVQTACIHVGSRNHNAKGPVRLVLATIRRVGPNQVPPKRALPIARLDCHSQSTPPNCRAPHIRRQSPPTVVERCDPSES